MVEITINNTQWDPDKQEFAVVRRATLRVDGTTLTCEGEEWARDFADIKVLHPNRPGPPKDRLMTLESDGEEWARYLPTHFRSGQIWADVIRDTASRAAPPALVDARGG